MKNILITLLLFCNLLINAQTQRKDSLLINENRFNISAGMGIKAISIKDVVSYLNNFIHYHDDEYSTIATSPDFYINTEYRFSDNYGMKLDYGYSVKTYNLENTNDILYHNISVTYSIHSPALLINYIVREPGYLLKFGAGLSYNFASFSQKTSVSKGEEIYTSNGPGFKLEAFGHSQLGTDVYMVIGLFVHAGVLGDLKNDSGKPLIQNKEINMSFISAGLSLGLAYYF